MDGEHWQSPAGFCEVEHTADWELLVWAKDVPGLFEQAAKGMMKLAGMVLQNGYRVVKQLEFEEEDLESLLVAFLDELLFYSEVEGLGFEEFEIRLAGRQLSVQAKAAPLAELKKEIKAVTYHRLSLEHHGQGYQVSIVFDV